MTQGQVGFGFNIGSNDAMEFQVFGLYSGVISKSAAAVATVPSAASGPIEFSTTSIPASTVYTQALTVRAGVQYRLP